jgi:hypothetical protein
MRANSDDQPIELEIRPLHFYIRFIDFLAEQLGRFASRSCGCARFRHFSKIDELEPGSETRRPRSTYTSAEKGTLDEHGYCEVV